MKKVTFLLFVTLLMLTTTGFDNCGSSPPPPPGFTVETDLGIFVGGIPTIVRVPHISIFGTWDRDRTGATGSRKELPSFAETNDQATYFVDDGRAPALWTFIEGNGQCKDQDKQFPVEQHGTLGLLCDTTGIFVPPPGRSVFTADPSSIDASNPPANVTIAGSGIDATYAMPYVQYYDMNGNLVAQEQASQVAPDGTSLVGPAPDLSGVDPGSYWLMVQNVAADGSLQLAGAVNIYVGTVNPPPPPPDGCGGSEQAGGNQQNQPVCGEQ